MLCLRQRYGTIVGVSNSDFHLPSDEPISTEILKDIQFRDVKIIVGLAMWCGWTTHKGKLFHLRAHDGTSMEIPTNTNLNIRVFRSRIRTILRHRENINTPPAVMVGSIIDTYKVDKSHAQILWALAKEVKPVKQPAAPFAPTTAEKYPVRKIVKQEPWSAHNRTSKKGGTQTYPSKAVMERTWSDNTTDYACRWEDCSYTNENPQSTARHFAAHRRGEGKAPQAITDGVDPTWTPQKRARIAKLRGEVDGALRAALSQGIDFSVVDQAEWIATWIIEHRVEPLGDGEGGGSERELTAEELLDRIAALASRGRTPLLRQQIDSLNAAVEGYMSEVDDARALAALATARAERAEGNLHTLRDLLNETDPIIKEEAQDG